MGSKNINQLPVASSVASTDKMVLETSGGTKSVAFSTVASELGAKVVISDTEPSDHTVLWIDTSES